MSIQEEEKACPVVVFKLPYSIWICQKSNYLGMLAMTEKIFFESVGQGVSELRIDYGPGYRMYFGKSGAVVVLLLCGGTKQSQAKDIRKAHKYWVEYQRRTT
ncbi:type II toxin-antitoxin system RelE/ParE family toxin [Candidatus Electrothrix sp.]|uniref:type II toxin-antitoxin system RelE/ParE family toxin n=1 Tax=Candidatus Electrothrix sp. TaxID=2170559 RepID=UPI004057702E